MQTRSHPPLPPGPDSACCKGTEIPAPEDPVSAEALDGILRGRRHAEDRFRSLLEAAPDAIVIVNRRGMIELINPETERMFGYSREEMLGKPVEMLVPESFRNEISAHLGEESQCSFNRCIGTGRIVSARRKDGSEFPAEIGVKPLHTEEGMLVISSIRDVTERTRAEDTIIRLQSELDARVDQRTADLRDANERLQNEMAMRRRLEQEILDISEREQQRIGRDLHDDLGQRLVGISYMSRVLAKELAAKASPDVAAAEKISALLNNALSLTRSLARGLHPVALKSGGLTAALVDLAERTSDMFQVSCRFSVTCPEPVLGQTTATHLYRITCEAVTNAVNHGMAKVIRIALSCHREQAVLSVSDDGTGMPEPDPQGKGMGLRIMKYRADSIGATLDFKRLPSGTGTLVTCTVPEAATPS